MAGSPGAPTDELIAIRIDRVRDHLPSANNAVQEGDLEKAEDAIGRAVDELRALVEELRAA